MNTVVPENHALHTLVKEKVPSFSELIKNLPVEKLGQLGAIINELKDM